MHQFQVQPRAEADRAGPEMRRKKLKVRRANVTGPAAPKGRGTGEGEAEGGEVSPAGHLSPVPGLPEAQGPPGLANDGLHDGQPARGAVAGQDHAFDMVNFG